jgi:c-di-GMP-binding flagellar brake protein YcgR
MEQEIYTNVKHIGDGKINLTVKSANILKEGKEVLCIVIKELEIFEFYSHVEESFEKTAYITKPIKSDFSNVEKRRFNRMDCNIGFIGRPVMIHDIMITKSDKQFSGTILNISAGGVLIQTNLKLPDYMIFKFKLKLNYFLECTAMIKRTFETDADNIYNSGCEFIEMPFEDMKTISLFVFKEQLKNRRKELNKSALAKEI